MSPSVPSPAVESKVQAAGDGQAPAPLETATPRRSARLSVGPSGDSWWARARWLVKGVLGENAYQAYLAHHERSGCAAPALSERDYWRSRTDWQERNPQGRCC
ncbi:YbdD/YjiX family protein [Ornithinimicrobium ciconiae]|uniref:YbdD/YjiX family protein n=1 Tax=Ornithinimicrobium ciconiae TaxID=2594265 RepID=A0A516GC82_9MICO|nr:YbdD/YjiX family protein [Ornithinimicrobium ciconiae]